MKILRLLLFEECNRKCDGCCNKDWDLKNVDMVESYSGFDEILLTGGEPMLKPELVIDTIKKIKNQSECNIYLYTAKVNDYNKILEILYMINGLTITLHEQEDVESFIILNGILKSKDLSNKSMRVNIFKGIDININMDSWIVKKNIEWIKDCPLPKNEILKRLRIRI